MECMEVKSENGCVVRYSETPIELPTKEKVYFKIESIFRAKNVSEEEMKPLLRTLENEINWEILKKTKANSLSPLWPHFYFDESLKTNADFDVMVKFFHMKPVEGFGIMLYPGREKVKE